MKIQEHEIDNKKIIHIYLNEQEKNEIKIQENIEQIKSKNEKVVLFISGENEPEKVIKEMIRYVRNENYNKELI